MARWHLFRRMRHEARITPIVYSIHTSVLHICHFFTKVCEMICEHCIQFRLTTQSWIVLCCATSIVHCAVICVHCAMIIVRLLWILCMISSSTIVCHCGQCCIVNPGIYGDLTHTLHNCAAGESEQSENGGFVCQCQCCWYRYRKWKDTVNTTVEIILIISHSRCGLQVWFSSHHWWFEFFWPIFVVVYFSWCYDLNDGEYKHKHNEVSHCDNCYVASKSDHWLSLRVVIIGQGLIFKIWRHMASAWTARTSAWAFFVVVDNQKQTHQSDDKTI